jgi:Mrp family chromosome partitioning ATPase
VLGIVLGLGLAFLGEALSTRVRSEEQVQAVLGLPLLGRIPKSARFRREHPLVTMDFPNGPDAEAFKIVTTNLDFVTLQNPAKTVMITSALPQEGKTTTISNLAVTLARQGRRVTLVDLDFQSPFVHHVFGLEEGPGLTDIVLGQASLDDAFVLVPVRDGDEPGALIGNEHSNGKSLDFDGSLGVLRCGTPPPNSDEFVMFQPVREILKTLASASDIVLIDAPPLLVSGAALALTAEVQGIIVLTRLKFLRVQALRELKLALDACPAWKLGLIIAGAEGMSHYGSGPTHPPSARRSAHTVSARVGGTEKVELH